MICPCKGCEKRYSGCHSKCDEYKEWKDWYNKKKEHENRIRSIESYRSNRYV